MRKIYVDVKATLLLTLDDNEEFKGELIQAKLTDALEQSRMGRGMPFVEVLDGVFLEVTDSK